MSIPADQLAQIRNQLFLIQSKTALEMPSTSVDAAGDDIPMATALDQMIIDLRAKYMVAHTDENGKAVDGYAGLGVGVVDFTKDLKTPRIWLNNETTPWRIASTGKLSILLAAMQLRDDVRLVKEVTKLTDPKVYDALFAGPALWSPVDKSNTDIVFRNSEITGGKKTSEPFGHCPRPSTIFDLTADPVDFSGPAITTAAAKAALALKVGWKSGMTTLPELKWNDVPNYDFSELLWLTGDMSDDVAATVCVSEIGGAYLKAVQKAYGLFDPAKSAWMLLSSGYDRHFRAVKTHSSGSAVLRPLRDPQGVHVTDALRTGGSVGSENKNYYTDRNSIESGSANALVAYLIALMQNRLVSSRNDPAHNVDNGTDACDSIRRNLSSGAQADNGNVFPGYASNIIGGIKAVTTVTRQLSKIGLLNEAAGAFPPGFSCEFVYVETTEKGTGKAMQYGVVVTGIRHNIETELGGQIHQTLLTT